MKQILIFLFVLVFSVVSSSGQSITGKVIDNIDNEPVINAVVKSIETGTIAITDINGKFKIKVAENSSLEISHISYKTIKVSAKQGLLIKLNPKQIGLDEIVVKSHPLDDISHSVVITDKIKKGSQPRNLADLFNDITGFSLQKRSSMATEPSFRSFKYEEMNIKYDGSAKIVHACPNRMDPITAHVIPEEVQKIEIVKGPYTVRYGQRFGATVNMLTKPSIPSKPGFHTNIESGYESNGGNLVGRAQLQYAANKYDITLNGEHRDFGNYIDGNGSIVPSSFKTQSYSVKLGVNPSTSQRLQMDFRAKYGSDIMHAGLPMDSPKDNSKMLSLDYKAEKVSKLINSILFKAYYSDVDHLMDNKLRPSFNFKYGRTPVTSNTLGGKLEFGLTPSTKWMIFAGFDADVIKRDGHKYVTINKNPAGVPLNKPVEKQFSVWQDATTQDYGVFFESNYMLASNLTANAGIRADYNLAHAEIPDKAFAQLYGGDIKDIDEVNIGGNISLKYSKNDLQIQLAYGRGTRSASMVERYINRFSIGVDSRDYIGNPYLKPEVNNQIDLSVNKYFHKFSIGGNVFYSLMQNYITARINSYFMVGENTGGCGSGPIRAPKQFWNVDAYQYGFEGFFKYNITSNLLFSSDFAYTYAQNTTYKEPLAQIAPLVSHIGVKWEKSAYWLDLRTRIVGTQDRYSKSFDESETPGFSILDFRAGVKVLKGLTIGGAALNILDKAYYNHLNFSYINSDKNQGRILEPGRNFSVYVKYKL